MSKRDIATARNPDLRASPAAMRRAAQMARKTAIQTGTELIVVRDGQIVAISGEALAVAAD